MSELISQRDLRNDNASVMRRVEQGEHFTVTRNGRPVAELVPLAPAERRRRTWGEVQQAWSVLPAIDAERWYAERASADEVFGSDDIEDA